MKALIWKIGTFNYGRGVWVDALKDYKLSDSPRPFGHAKMVHSYLEVLVFPLTEEDSKTSTL